MNLYKIKYRDYKNATSQYVVATSISQVLESITDGMNNREHVIRDDWKIDDLEFIKLIESDIAVLDDE